MDEASGTVHGRNVTGGVQGPSCSIDERTNSGTCEEAEVEIVTQRGMLCPSLASKAGGLDSLTSVLETRRCGAGSRSIYVLPRCTKSH